MFEEWLNRNWLRVKALLGRKRLDGDLEDELAFHLAMSAEKNREFGMEADEARYAARRQFGNASSIKERNREMWTFAAFESFWQDLRYGARMMAKNPGFTAAVVLAIALGVGINVGIFSVLNGVALRLLPIPRADQVVNVDQLFQGKIHRIVGGEPTLFSYSEYRNYRDHNQVFSGLLAYSPFLTVTLGGGKSQQLSGQLASCNYFDVLNERPAQGRGFVEADCAAAGASAVAVVSDDLWRNSFDADPLFVGKKIILNRVVFTVIGIAPRGFGGTELESAAFWTPVTMQKTLEPEYDFFGDDNTSWLALLGRVQPGVSPERVRADLAIIAGRIDQLYPGRKTTLAIRTATFLGRPEEHRDVMGVGAVVLIAFGLVLLIAGANVANLLLARASVRQKEIALRLSIGAGRWRIVRQLLTESLLLALLGGALGSLLAVWSFAGIMRYVMAHLPQGFPPLALNLSPDIRVLGYALVLTLVTGIAFGLAPALQASRPDLNTALKEDSAVVGGRTGRGSRLRSVLVGTQVAVCMILLIAAGLLLRGLYFAQTMNPGFTMKAVTVASLDLTTQSYDEDRSAVFQQQLMQRLAALPGVDAVVEARETPLGSEHTETIFTIPERQQEYQLEDNFVSQGYFSMLEMPIVRGRDFAEAEVRSGAHVVIVTESTARRLWPGEEVIGKTLRQGNATDLQVVGVVRDAQVSEMGNSEKSYVYLPAGPKEQRRMRLLVHSAGGYAPTANGIRDAVHALDAEMSVGVTKLEDNLEVSRTGSRIVAGLSGALGALALLLASIGVYGVVSYAVSRRVHEIGIRMALGANGREVMSLLLRQAMKPVLIGGVIGIAGCAAVSQVLSSMMFGLSAHDPIAFILVPSFLLGVALVASYIPARRAMKVEPVMALRYE